MFLSFLRVLAQSYAGREVYIIADWWHSSPERDPAIRGFLQEHSNLHLSPTPLLAGTGLWLQWVAVWLNGTEFAGPESLAVTAKLLAGAVKTSADILLPIAVVIPE
jgi:hypothetical protein